MFHPLIKLLASRPDLLISHVGAYAQLAAVQAADGVLLLRRRAILGAAAVGALVMGVALAGGAVLLLAVVPIDAMPAPWLLVVAPGTPLLLAGILLWQIRREPWAWSLTILREQMAADAALLAQIQAD